jgi:hypothetical protein
MALSVLGATLAVVVFALLIAFYDKRVLLEWLLSSASSLLRDQVVSYGARTNQTLTSPWQNQSRSATKQENGFDQKAMVRTAIEDILRMMEDGDV